MSRIEGELYDLEEYLRRNDDSADSSAYLTIVGIANDVSELDAENAKLREERDHWHVEQIHAFSNWEDAYKRATELEAENAKLRELVRDYHTFLALAELAQPIGHIIAAHGHPTLSVKALDERYRELGIEVKDA